MRYLLPISFAALAALSINGCKESTAPAATAAATDATPAAPPAPAVEPGVADSLLKVLGPLDGKVVADFYAGDGSYAWLLLNAGARVLAIEDDPAKAAALEARKKSEGIGNDRLLVRLVPPGTVGLLPNEADMALITREYSTLGDRPAWFAQLMAGVKPPHLFYLVNFFPGQSPAGPPLSQRMDYNLVADEVSSFGYGDVGVFYKKLPYRYILFGNVPPPQPPGGE